MTGRTAGIVATCDPLDPACAACGRSLRLFSDASAADIADPEGVAVVAKTEKDGQLVENISSQLLAPAAFLP